uniref:FRIGIDA-like protein n=1 Tax=Angiostrongylus cantonensis TaxID=6313 RepID=A0A0K0D680_ANGCA
LDRRILTDVERLQQISLGKPREKLVEETIAARWLIASEWDSIVHILLTFLGIKDRRKARQRVQDGIEHSIKGMQLLAAVALELGESYISVLGFSFGFFHQLSPMLY